MESWNDLDVVSPVGPARRQAGDRLRSALDAIVQALSSPAASLESVRGVVVRYGAVARDHALQIDEMIATLTRSVARAIEPLPTPQRDEMLASVQWWAVHGYHRAD